MNSISVYSIYRSRNEDYDKSDNQGNTYFTTDIIHGYTFFGEESGIQSYVKKSGFPNYWEVKKTDDSPFKLLELSQNMLSNLAKNPIFAEYFTNRINVFKKNEDNEWVRISEEAKYDREFFSKLFKVTDISKLFKVTDMINYDGIYTEESKLHPHREYIVFARVKKTRKLIGNTVTGSSGSPQKRLASTRSDPPVTKRRKTMYEEDDDEFSEGVIKIKVPNLFK